MKPRRWLAILCGVVAGWACTTVSAQTLPADTTQPSAPPSRLTPIIEGTMMRTARGGGRWQTFFNAHETRFRAANRDAIWFGSGENLWRYNVAQKKIDATVSPLTHPDFRFSGSMALADDGSCAIASGARIYLWTPREGWSRLPQVSGAVNDHFPAFDHENRLYVSNYQGVYRWSDGLWQVFAESTVEKRLVPVANGWAQLEYSLWYDHRLSQQQSFTQGAGPRADLAAFYRVQGNAYAFFWARGAGQTPDSTLACLYHVTPDRLIERGAGKQLGLDLATGEGFRCKVDANGASATIESLKDQAVQRIAMREDQPALCLMLRDANGHYWRGAYRFDGRTWEAVLPPGAFIYAGDMQEGILTGRLQHDPQKQTWVDTTPEIPVDVKQYDAATRTGWLKRYKPLGSNERTVWEQIRFGADGSRTIVQSVKANDRGYPFCTPRFADRQGNWWFRGRWRWDGQGAHVYDDGYETRNTKENIVLPELLLSDAGTVWQYKMDHTWHRFAPELDRFVLGAPYDDFSFVLGGRTFSIPARARDLEFDQACLRVYEKREGKWETFQTPFGVSGIVGHAPWVYGLPKMLVRDSRMLVATQGGIFEWDSLRDRWAYLMPRGQYWACFDAHGHRIMSGEKFFNQILLYDGDPIAPAGADVTELEKTLERLMQEMGDPAWRKRTAATTDMTNLLRQNPTVVGDYLTKQLANKDGAPELRWRIQSVLADRPQPTAQRYGHDDYAINLRQHVGNSLFERMVQPLTPKFPDGYVLRLGMRFDHAQSILLAAGAQEMITVRRELTHRGFLLRDNTMVYLRVDATAKPPKITHLGMGPDGAGLDKTWDWSDTKLNTKVVELDPAPTLQPAK